MRGGKGLPFVAFINMLKEISEIQYKRGQKVSLWVTEEFPLIYVNRALEILTDIECAFITSSYKIEKNHLKTCKSLCINRKLSEALSKVSHNQLIKEIIKIKKQERI